MACLRWLASATPASQSCSEQLSPSGRFSFDPLSQRGFCLIGFDVSFSVFFLNSAEWGAVLVKICLFIVFKEVVHFAIEVDHYDCPAENILLCV